MDRMAQDGHAAHAQDQDEPECGHEEDAHLAAEDGPRLREVDEPERVPHHVPIETAERRLSPDRDDRPEEGDQHQREAAGEPNERADPVTPSAGARR